MHVSVFSLSSDWIGAGSSPRLLDWNSVQHKLPWNVVILLGSGFALAEAAQVSTNHAVTYMYMYTVYNQFIFTSSFNITFILPCMDVKKKRSDCKVVFCVYTCTWCAFMHIFTN